MVPNKHRQSSRGVNDGPRPHVRVTPDGKTLDRFPIDSAGLKAIFDPLTNRLVGVLCRLDEPIKQRGQPFAFNTGQSNEPNADSSLFVDCCGTFHSQPPLTRAALGPLTGVRFAFNDIPGVSASGLNPRLIALTPTGVGLSVVLLTG